MCLESLILQASVRTLPRLAITVAEAAADKIKARDLFERVLKVLDGSTTTSHPSPTAKASISSGRSVRSVQSLKNDTEMHVEIATLWQSDNIERATKALHEAIRIKALSANESVSAISPSRLRSNLAVLKHLNGGPLDARGLYEEALLGALAEPGTESESTSSTILYNLARAYEDMAEFNYARDAYNKLLSRHPEYTDGSLCWTSIVFHF